MYLISDKLYSIQNLLWFNLITYNNRIETPYYVFFSHFQREFFKCRDSFIKRWYIFFKFFFFIIIQSKMKIGINTLSFQVVQIFYHWNGIFRPENNESCITKSYILRFTVKGINPSYITPFQPVYKPVCIKSGYIS